MKIGIIGLKSRDHLAGEETPRYLGGIETQLAVLAKGLVTRGCEVDVVTYDHGQPAEEIHDGVRTIKCYGPDAGIRLLRFIHPRYTKLLAAMKKADADVWLQMGAGLETGLTAWICRVLKRPFVFCMASDANFGSHLTAGPMGVEGRIYQFGLNEAEVIIAQTRRQKMGLLDAARHESTIVPMAVSKPTDRRSQEEVQHVLWVGRIMPTKRLEWLIESAKLFPETVFHVVGAPNANSPHAERLMNQAGEQPNMRVHGRAPAATLSELYSKATVLACTSELEGFPTTFLESWSIGLPVVTTFDPDGVVAANGLGEVAEDLEDFQRKLRHVLEDDSRRHEMSLRTLEYFKANHSSEEVSRRFHEMLEAVADYRASSMPGVVDTQIGDVGS